MAWPACMVRQPGWCTSIKHRANWWQQEARAARWCVAGCCSWPCVPHPCLLLEILEAHNIPQKFGFLLKPARVDSCLQWKV